MTKQNRIRVLFPYTDGDTIGGSHTSSLTLAAQLDQSEFCPTILLHGKPGELGRHVSELGLRTLRLEQPPVLAGRLKQGKGDASFPSYLLRSVPALVRLLRRERIDIVHTNDGGMHASWALPAKIAGARFLWHHRQAPEARGVNLIAPLFADRILSVSEFSRPSRPILPVANRFEVVRSPFKLSPDLPDRDLARRALLAEIGAPSDAIVIGYFGALTPRKRPDHFIRVIQEMRMAMPNRSVHGVVFGAEPVAGLGVEMRCKALVEELGLMGHVHLMGHRTPVEPLLSAVEVLAVTALDEPFGRTLIEAMHLGTPVVATHHGGNPEAIVDGESGFLVDPGNPAAFVPAIKKILDEPERRRQITDAAARFSRGLTIDAHVTSVSAVYRKLTESPKAKHNTSADAKEDML
ncbi:MAG: glycosyltransferase family 4 protein [Pseudomonadota bacterium]